MRVDAVEELGGDAVAGAGALQGEEEVVFGRTRHRGDLSIKS